MWRVSRLQRERGCDLRVRERSPLECQKRKRQKAKYDIALLQVAALGEISGGDAAKSGKIFLAPQGRRGQVSRLNRDLGPNCGALRARRYAPGATRHDLGPFEGFGPKIFSRPYREKQGFFATWALLRAVIIIINSSTPIVISVVSCVTTHVDTY